MSKLPTEHVSLLTLRKYPNRRYYDSTHSRHLTLEQIYALIRRGYEVQVTDSQSGKDITAKVLAQIIIDLDAQKLSVFPVGMLHRLLQSNEKLVRDFVQQYFNQPLQQFLDSQRNMERYVRQAMGVRSRAPTLADWTKMMLAPMARTAGSSRAGSEPDLREVVAELRSEVARLRAAGTGRGRGGAGARGRHAKPAPTRPRGTAPHTRKK